jgi:hypothetical protein
MLPKVSVKAEDLGVDFRNGGMVRLIQWRVDLVRRSVVLREDCWE